jgi:hypothetical protein
MEIFLSAMILLTSSGQFQWSKDKTHGDFIERVQPMGTGEIEISGNLGDCMVYPYEEGSWTLYPGYSENLNTKKLVVKFMRMADNKSTPFFGSFKIYCRREDGRGTTLRKVGEGGADRVQPLLAVSRTTTARSRIVFKSRGL